MEHVLLQTLNVSWTLGLLLASNNIYNPKTAYVSIYTIPILPDLQTFKHLQ